MTLKCSKINNNIIEKILEKKKEICPPRLPSIFHVNDNNSNIIKVGIKYEPNNL